jgi:hypothetical protein
VSRIECPIGLYEQQEAKIAEATQGINHASTAAAKAPWAASLLSAVDVLLACETYDASRAGCQLCRGFATLRSKTAALVIKAGKLQR